MQRAEIYDKICISYWLPKLLEADLPVPRTEIVQTDADLLALLDGEEPDGYAEFKQRIEKAVESIGLPVFLRTGHSAFKHYWSKTCFVDGSRNIAWNICSMVEHSHMTIPHLPTSTWAIREFLDLRVSNSFEAFDGVPIGKEVRCFFRQGQFRCCHPYWPPGAIRGHTSDPDWIQKLDVLSTLDENENQEVESLVDAVMPLFPEFGWSVDFCKDAKGKWWLTDMALAPVSYHWDTCEHLEMFDRQW